MKEQLSKIWKTLKNHVSIFCSERLSFTTLSKISSHLSQYCVFFIPLLELCFCFLSNSPVVLLCTVSQAEQTSLISAGTWQRLVNRRQVWEVGECEEEGRPWISPSFFAFHCISSSSWESSVAVGCLCWVLYNKNTTVWWLKQQ